MEARTGALFGGGGLRLVCDAVCVYRAVAGF